MTRNNNIPRRGIDIQPVHVSGLEHLRAMTTAERVYFLDYLYFHLLLDENVWLRPFVIGEISDPDKTDCLNVFVVKLRPDELIRFYVPADRDPYEALPEFFREMELQLNVRIQQQDQ